MGLAEIAKYSAISLSLKETELSGSTQVRLRLHLKGGHWTTSHVIGGDPSGFKSWDNPSKGFLYSNHCISLTMSPNDFLEVVLHRWQYFSQLRVCYSCIHCTLSSVSNILPPVIHWSSQWLVGLPNGLTVGWTLVLPHHSKFLLALVLRFF